jgi:hypothetical protein
MPFMSKISDLKTNRIELPNGTVVQYRKEMYWVSEGTMGRILTDTKGHWFFIKDLNWRKFTKHYVPCLN